MSLHLKTTKKQIIKFSSDNAEIYNRSTSVKKLQDVLRRSHDPSPEPDKIHYKMLKHLPNSVKYH